MQKLIWTHYTRLEDAGSSEPDPVHFNLCVLMVLTVDHSSYEISLIYKSSSPREMTRAIESLECPLGMEILVGGPRSSSSSGSESWGGF